MNAPFNAKYPALSIEAAAVDPHSARRRDRPEHDARALTAGGVEARILLDGTPYVLRITRLGKLILTK